MEERRGKDTEKYLHTVVNRLTLFGSFALGFIALGPIIGQIFLDTNITVGGTSVLILVAVALETLRQVESRALMVTYDDYSTPDFVYGPDNAAQAALGARTLRFLPRRTKKAKNDKKANKDK